MRIVRANRQNRQAYINQCNVAGSIIFCIWQICLLQHINLGGGVALVLFPCLKVFEFLKALPNIEFCFLFVE